MPRRDERRGGERRKRLLPVLLSAAIVLPNNPFVSVAAAQAMGAAEIGAARAGANAGPSAGAAAVSAPVPLSLTPSTFAAPLTGSAPSMVVGAAPSPAAALTPLSAASSSPEKLPAASPAAVHPAQPAALPAPAAAVAAPLAASLPAGSVSGVSRADSPTGKSSESGENGGETAKLGALFDGQKALNPDAVKIFLVRQGREPIVASLSSLDSILKNKPGLAMSLNKNGAVRLVLGKGGASGDVRAEDVPGLTRILRERGVSAPVTPEKLTVEAPRTAATAAADAAAATEAANASLPVRMLREVRFLGRTFKDSMTRPLPSEVIGGIATKSFPLVTSIGVYWATVGLAHPFAMAGLMALSLFQETFHGIFLNTWNNFQDNLSRLRGFSYQMYFNLVYMQGFGALYRALSWSANPHKTIPPWSPFYWQDVLVMSVVGTFFGTLGYNGLNTLYAKGRLKRWQRSGIQQIRDVMFLLAGPFFATGSMHAFWALFIFQQSLDLAIALLAWRARTRTLLYVADDALAASPEFKAKYPAAFGIPEVSPVKQAWDGVVGNPLVKLVLAPFKWAAGRLKKA